MAMRTGLLALVFALAIAGCGQDIYITNVERHYTEHGSPRNVSIALLEGHFMKGEFGNYLCDTPQCRFMIAIEADIPSSCIDRVDGQHVGVSGRISRGALTDIDSIHLPDNSVACVL